MSQAIRGWCLRRMWSCKVRHQKSAPAPRSSLSRSRNFKRRANLVSLINDAVDSADQHHVVRALYDYEAQEAGEFSLQEGQLIQLTDGPSGGRNYADGWWEGVILPRGT
jgi:hypothetical protein